MKYAKIRFYLPGYELDVLTEAKANSTEDSIAEELAGLAAQSGTGFFSLSNTAVAIEKIEAIQVVELIEMGAVKAA